MTSAAPHVVIRRCVIRVTRRGGWSWGPDPTRVRRAAVERLPALLARRLAHLASAAPSEDLEIAEPLVMRVPIPAREWTELVAGDGAPEASLPVLDAALAAALARASLALDEQPALLAEHDAVSAPGAAREEDVPDETATPGSHARLSALHALLLRWREEGELARELGAFDSGVLAMWLERLVSDDPAPRAAVRAADEVAVAEARARVDTIKLLMPAGAARERAREVLFVTEILAARADIGVSVCSALRALRALDRGAATESSDAAEPAGELPASEAARAAALEARARHTFATAAASPASRASAAFEIDVPCALPFLVLGPLARAGYLARLAGMLEAARAGALAHGFGHGLARKVLAAPALGWLRASGEVAAAAALGARADCDEDSISGVARALRPQSSVLDRCIAETLVRDHRATAGWILARAPSGAVLFDEDGLVPVALGEPGAFAPRIAPSGSVAFLGEACAGEADLDVLDALQIPYGTEASLAHREGADDFVGADGRRRWIARHGGQRGRLRALATCGRELGEEALAGWSALRNERPALRPGVDATFENTLALAAAYALGVIAWTLWSTRERPTPATALERFADFDARVHVTRAAVHVALPLGRRFWDLRDRGLLADVRGVPWLGRPVTFGTG
jgi:hypothetical protein